MGRLYRLPPDPDPRVAGWLVPPSLSAAGANCSELGYEIVLRAFRDIGIREQPWGSNRGTRIDRMTRRAGLTPPQWWCAIWVGCVWADVGAMVPEGFPSCDAWLEYLEPTSATPQAGDAVLYGLRKAGREDAHHIGIVADPADGRRERIITIEGNRAYAGTASNNGVAVDVGPMIRRDVLGYVRPRLAA